MPNHSVSTLQDCIKLTSCTMLANVPQVAQSQWVTMQPYLQASCQLCSQVLQNLYRGLHHLSAPGDLKCAERGAIAAFARISMAEQLPER